MLPPSAGIHLVGPTSRYASGGGCVPLFVQRGCVPLFVQRGYALSSPRPSVVKDITCGSRLRPYAKLCHIGAGARIATMSRCSPGNGGIPLLLGETVTLEMQLRDACLLHRNSKDITEVPCKTFTYQLQRDRFPQFQLHGGNPRVG